MMLNYPVIEINAKFADKAYLPQSVSREGNISTPEYGLLLKRELIYRRATTHVLPLPGLHPTFPKLSKLCSEG